MRRDADSRTGPTIAVLPLKKLTGDREEDFLAAGLSEELIAELGRFRHITVTASQASSAYDAADASVRRIGEDLGARFLVSGSVRSGGDRIRITLQLIDAPTGQQLWAERFESPRTGADLIELQNRIAQQVVGRIADHYGVISSELLRATRRRPDADPCVYDAILHFHHYLRSPGIGRFREAFRNLEMALSRSPNSAVAMAHFAELHGDDYFLEYRTLADNLELCGQYARNSVELEPEGPEAHIALAWYHFLRKDSVEFLHEVDIIESFNPSAPFARGWLGLHLYLAGQQERGRKLLDRALALTPTSPGWFLCARYVDLFALGSYEEALHALDATNSPNTCWYCMHRASTLAYLERPQEARAALEKLFELIPDFAERPREVIGKSIWDEDLLEHVLHGLRLAGLESNA